MKPETASERLWWVSH